MDVHSVPGPGLLDSPCQECLNFSLIREGFYAEKQQPMPLVFDQVELACGCRINILAERQPVLEIKSADTLDDIPQARILTYMKLGQVRPSLLFNLNVVRLKLGTRRIINDPDLPHAQPVILLPDN